MPSIITKHQDSEGLIRLVNVGARFGLHPAFKGMQRACKVSLIEADSEECARLQVRYADVPNVQIVNAFVSNRPQTESNSEILNIYKHPGGNPKFKVDETSPYWKNLRPGTSEIQGTIAVPAVDLDSCVAHYLQGCDFLKIDIEGAELEVLAGAKKCLSGAGGVRKEVLFNSLYSDLEETF
jgi:FkbM family methyltransferase